MGRAPTKRDRRDDKNEERKSKKKKNQSGKRRSGEDGRPGKKQKKRAEVDVDEVLLGDALDGELKQDRKVLRSVILDEDDKKEEDAYAHTEKRWMEVDAGGDRTHYVNTKPTIENYVCTFHLGLDTPIDRPRLALRLLGYGAQFNPHKFASITLKLRKNRLSPSGVALIFSTGKVVLTGTKSLSAASLVAHRVAYLVNTVGGYHRARMLDLHVRNIVGCLRTGAELDLVAMCSVLRGAAYDPENFPGLIYRSPETNIRFLVYTSGKLVITGAKTEQDIDDGALYIAPHCGRVIRGSASARRIAQMGDYGIHSARD